MRLLTANRLTDGAVVWFAPGDVWATDVADAARLDAEEAVAAFERAQAAFRQVVGAYLIDIDASGEITARERLREAIRSGGPSAGHSLKAA